MIRAYCRVSTDAQAESGAGLAAQRAAIVREAQHRGWDDVQWYVEEDGRTGGNLDRPAWQRMVSDMTRSDVIVAAKVDRLSRSLIDFSQLLQTAQKRGWVVLTLDLGLDLSTPQGEFVASVLASFARMEQRLIGQRTRDAMRAKKEAGEVRYGHRSTLPDHVQDEVERLIDSGLSRGEVARRMTSAGVRTAQGSAVWYASTVGSLLRSRANDRLAGLVS